MNRINAVLSVVVLLLAGLAFQSPITENLSRSRTWVTDFGAIPNDGKDDSAAIIACRRAALALGTYHVHFPAGVWDIDGQNVLHPYSNGDGTYSSSASKQAEGDPGGSLLGIRFTGDSQNYSVLRLHRDEGNERWLYDAETPGLTGIGSWNRVQFSDLTFESNLPNAQSSGNYDPAYCAEVNGVRIWSNSPTVPNTATRGFVFDRVRFFGLGHWIAHTGGTNTDSTNVTSFWVDNCGPLLFDNQNALACNFTNGHIWYSDHAVLVKATPTLPGSPRGGGGWVNFINCDWIAYNTDGDTTPHYTVKVEDNANFRWFWNFIGNKWELRGPEQRFISWTQTQGFVSSAHVSVLDSSFGAMQQNVAGVGGGGADPDGRRYIMDLGPVSRVVCTRTSFADQFAIQFSNHTAGAVVGQAHQGTVVLDGCTLPVQFLSGTDDTGTSTDATRGLAGRIALSNGYGRVIGRNNYSFNGTTIERRALDFDFGGQNAARAEPGVQRHRVFLKTSLQAWPRWVGGVATTERTILLPENVRIVAAGIDAPAQGSGSTLVQYRIGSDDKATTYVASGPVRSDSRHVAAAGNLRIDVGSDLNRRRVRLWMGPAESAFNRTGGEAWVEYVPQTGDATAGTGTSTGAYPSPYVDDWAIVVGVGDLRGGVVDAETAIAACLAASGRAILGEGTYLLTPSGATSIAMADGQTIEGSGIGKTILKMADGQAGVAVTLADDCVLRKLSIRSNDTASTLGARMQSGKHRGLYDQVEFADLATGSQDGNAAVNGLTYRDCLFRSNGIGFTTAFASSNVVLDGCRGLDNTSVDFRLSSSPTDVAITNCYTAGGPLGLQNNSGIRAFVAGNNFTNGMTAPAANSRCTYINNGDDGTPLTPASFAGTQTLFDGRMYAAAEPTSGVWRQGEAVWHSNPGTSLLNPLAWICSTPGTAGVDAVFQPLYRGNRQIHGDKTWDPPELVSGASASTTVPIAAGSSLGDFCLGSFSQELPDGFQLHASVISGNNVRVTLSNIGGATTNLAEGELHVLVIGHP